HAASERPLKIDRERGQAWRELAAEDLGRGGVERAWPAAQERGDAAQPAETQQLELDVGLCEGLAPAVVELARLLARGDAPRVGERAGHGDAQLTVHLEDPKVAFG